MAIVVKISQWLASPEQVAQIAPWSLALRESWLHGTRTTQTCVSHSASKRVRTILGNFLVLPETGIGSLKTRYVESGCLLSPIGLANEPIIGVLAR